MGGSNANPPSRFLQDIPSHLTDFVGLFESVGEPLVDSRSDEFHSSEGGDKPLPYFTLLTLEAGDHVHHAKFGEGVVISCTPARGDQEIVVAFEEAGVKKLLLSLAPLKRIE